MDHEAAEVLRERAVSSEPCSARPKPFDDTEPSSRKRQRLSRGESRSKSVDRALDLLPNSRAQEGHTPTQRPTPPDSTSSRVTINLRTTRRLQSIPSSPRPLPASPSKMTGSGEENGTRISVETESDALSTAPIIETPSSSQSASGSPEVELIGVNEDDPDFAMQSPPLAIIGEDDLLNDPTPSFPAWEGEASLVDRVQRLSQVIQHEAIEDETIFCRLRDWIESYLVYTNDHIDKWFGSSTKYREFWHVLPELIWSLSWRSRFFGIFLQKSRQGRAALSELLGQFARLTGRFVAMDVKALLLHGKSTDEGPELGARPYLHAISHLIRKEDTAHIGRNLERHYNWDWSTDIDVMTSSFETEGGSIENLTKLVECQLRIMSRNPRKYIDNMSEPSRIVSKVICNAMMALEEPENQHIRETVRQLTADGFNFFKVMSTGLDTVLEKHLTSLSSDSGHIYVESLSSILIFSVRYHEDVFYDAIQNTRRGRPALQHAQMPKVIATEWKFSVLKRLIVSAQMQLRVSSIGTMCQDLLNLFNTGKGMDAAQSPILLHFADFILRNKLIDYIVGIGSHPEIINESFNILGFLIATKVYQPQQTDMIWQTVKSSQDPRVVEAILRMMSKCFNLYDYQALLYICKKARDLPLESFALPIREFCQALCMDLVMRLEREGIQVLDSPPYDLCVWLVRQSSVITDEYPAGHPEIQNFAASRLRDLLPHGPGAQSRNTIYLACIRDISDQKPTAPGSICVINALLRQNVASDLKILTHQHGLTQLVVDELESTITDDRQSTNPSVSSSPASHARRELLLLIIIHEPSTITPELGTRLWNLLVGSQSGTPFNRTNGWQILNGAARKISVKNIFLSTCFREHLPKLPPDFFTPGALDFAREAVLSWMVQVHHDSAASDGNFESPPLEQLWRMILTAPANTIDALAINILVEVYVDSGLILSLPRPQARSIHLTLVNRCLKQLSTAATNLKAFKDSTSSNDEEGMVIVISDSQFQDQERIFARSLAVLREFLKSYQTKPQFATPKLRSPMPITSSAVEGDPLTVKYQSFDGDKQTEVKSLTIGKLNTTASLLAGLQKATGFKHYKVFYWGKEFDPDEVELCKSLDDLNLNLNGLVLVQRRDELDGHLGASTGSKSAIESEITKHFDELWGYLGMQDKVAQEIYYFLIKFPIYDRLLNDLKSEAVPHSAIFPPGKPFKCLYSLHALREYIRDESNRATLDEAALTRAIALIVAAISDSEVLSNCAGDELKDHLAAHLTDCLIQFLREPEFPASVVPLLNESLSECLLHLLYDAKRSPSTQNSVQLTWMTFDAILETSLHSVAFWTAVKSHLSNSDLLQSLILDDPRIAIRKNAVKQITNKCTYNPSLAQVSATNFLAAFWPMVMSLVPQAIYEPKQSEDTFGLAVSLFKKLADTSLETLVLDDFIREWSSLLLSHDCHENTDHPESIDAIIQGLTNLIYMAVSLSKVSGQQLSCSAIGVELFRRHLFPPIHRSPSRATITVKPKMPLLTVSSRRTMSEAVFYLVKDDAVQYKKLLKMLIELVAYDSSNDPPYNYDFFYQFERSKSIRSSTGYVGLKNLSNTCYLNSLFTQLFMNVPFREFMFSAGIADAGASQKLLYETQVLFAFMQDSLKRYADPTNLAASIRTYDDGIIDVSIQMDVDEFFNLLFDRLEGQFLASEAKQKFRSFYGGQLVQQVKSKECPHISERLEPFSAIQCDIKGKSSLEESLQAYVDGEVMEGDNKYKCSTCDRHVDAVKRACLKDIPDNLIFHLKRFDFNLRTLQRSKINDYFAFPQKIDMRSYKVEHLISSPEETPEDVFELVGILVHSGTAESGHYYSFTRERPSNHEKEGWVEFNDDSVTPWDPSSMESSCFGGLDLTGSMDGGNVHYDKSYSAYMLFYQRSSVLAAQKQALQESQMICPVRLPIDPRLTNYIAEENQIIMRKYCLYDPSHAPFVLKMLLNIKHINKGRCSEDHGLEKLALTTALNHVDQVVSRTKDIPDFPKFMVSIKQMYKSCAECSRDVLEWFDDTPEALRYLILKNPESTVRSEVASSIFTALLKVKNDAAYAYGLGDEDESPIELNEENPKLLQRIVHSLYKLWDTFHSNIKAWPEYFGLLDSIAGIGDQEAAMLLDKGFLAKALDVITADPNLPLNNQLQRMLTIISKRVAARPVSYEAVIGLLSTLLGVCEIGAGPVSDSEDRLEAAFVGDALLLNETEHNTLVQHWMRGDIHILTDKLLQINQNESATQRILVMLLHSTSPDTLDHLIYSAIIHGIRRNQSVASCGSYLRAAVTYCEHTESRRGLHNMMVHVARVASRLDTTEGREFLQFFVDVTELDSNHNDIPKDNIFLFFLKEVHTWAPAMLTYYDPVVRLGCEEFIQEKILRYDLDVELEIADGGVDKGAAIVDAARKLGITCLEHLHETYLKQRQQAVRAALLSIQKVIDFCSRFYDSDPLDPATLTFKEQRSVVLSNLKKCMVEEADDDVSDWEGSDGEYGSSEPVDSITELCGPIDTDLNDAEVRL